MSAPEDIDALVERLDVYAQVAVGDESLVPTELTTKAAAALRELQKRPTREQFILTRDLLSEKIDKQAQRIAELEKRLASQANFIKTHEWAKQP